MALALGEGADQSAPLRRGLLNAIVATMFILADNLRGR